jgi:hypothetical protein
MAAERGVWDLGNYEQKMGYFPVISGEIWSVSSSSLKDRVSDEERYAMGADYVVVWSVVPEKVGVSPQTSEWLKRNFNVVYKFAPRGFAVVWRKKR